MGAVGWAELSTETQAAVLGELERARRVVDAALASGLVAVERSTVDGRRGLDAAAWFANTRGVSMGDARGNWWR